MRFLRNAPVWGCVALMAAMATSEAPAQSPAEPVVAESERRLEQIRLERGVLDGEILQMRSRARDLSGDVRQLDRQVGTSSGALNEIEAELQQRNEQINQTARDLIITRHQLAARRAVLHRRLRTIYKRGPVQSAQVLLSATSFADLIHRYKYLVLVARHDRKLVREVTALESQLVARERLLERAVASLHDARAESSIIHGQLARILAEQERELTTISSREREAAQRVAQLESDERSIRALLASLDRSRASEPAATAAPEASTLGTAATGGLSWPVQGSLLYGFGRATQANGTAIRWNGIGIGAPAGAPVRAVEAGTVVMAGPFDAYGPTVVVSHGGGYYSLYLYLQQIRVREGESIPRNHLVGTVGGGDGPEGPHIEFQIRGPGGEAVDPLAWLQERRID